MTDIFPKTKFGPTYVVISLIAGEGGDGNRQVSNNIKFLFWCKVPPEQTQLLMSSRLVNIYLPIYRLGLGPQNFPHYFTDVKLCRLQQVAIGKLQSCGLLLDRLYTSGVNTSL